MSSSPRRALLRWRCARIIILSALLTTVASTRALAQRAERGQRPDEATSHTLAFSTGAPGEKLRLTNWGLDTAWADADNMRRGLLYMGPDQVDVVRVSFPISTPLVDGDLPESKWDFFRTRLEIAKLAGDKPFTMLPDTDAGVNPWFKDGKDVNPQRWLQLMSAAQRHYGKKLQGVEAFNEADWGWGQGSAQNLRQILEAIRKSEDFAGVELAGPSTLSSDAALAWYETVKDQVDRGTTHALGGGMVGFVNFFKRVAADGKVAEHPEVHNLAEVIAGAEYGLQSAIWWGTAELARGEFVKSVQGERLAYAEDRPHFSAAAVYRSPGGALRAFLGSSERQGQDTTFRFVCRDRAVFFNGDGPRREFTTTVRRDNESLINITWGADVAPKVGGNYAIVNRHSGKVLGVVAAGHDNGAAIEQTEYRPSATSQQWEVAQARTRYGDQSYCIIRAVHSGKVLSIPEHSYAEHDNVRQWGDGDSASQHWYFEYVGDNCFRIRNRWSTQCLTAADTADVQQASPTEGSTQQQWRLVPVAGLARVDFDPPARPSGPTANVKPVSVELRWEPNGEPDLASYTVLRSATAGGPYETSARDVTGNTFVDHDVTAQAKYFYVVKAVDRSLNSSPLSEEISAAPAGGKALVANYRFDGDAKDDSGNAFDGEAFGAPTYGVGRGGSRALVLDGENDFVRLPPGMMDSQGITVATWVYLQAGAQWQRIFDFGNDESQYLFLTPSSSDNTLRLAAKNGGEELRLDAQALHEGRWTHLAVSIGGKTARLFVNGKLVASSDAWTIKPSDFKPVFNYIGKSQFAVDPLLAGRISDFRIYNHALEPDDVASLMTRSSARESK